jgi:fructose-bisphosphate aldolase, class I
VASGRPTGYHSPAVLRNLQQIFDHGRLAGTGYLSILPVDQGIEHSAGASFAPNPIYFDPENIVKLAIEGGCNAVASTSACSARWRASTRTRSRSSVKLNHNELLTYPNKYDQIMFARSSRRSTWARGRRRDHLLRLRGVGAADPGGQRGLRAGPRAGHGHGALVLPAQQRLQEGQGLPRLAADLTGQANHLGVTIQADIIKQKLPENNGGYNARPRELRQDPQAVYESSPPITRST